MYTVTLADAKTDLSRLIELVEAGEEVTITRRGRPVARLVAHAPLRPRLPSLAELRASLPRQTEPACDFIRALREGERY